MIVEALLLSCKVACFSVVLVLIPGVWLGYILERRRFPGRSLAIGLTHAPLVVPPVATGYVLLVVMGRNGILGSALYRSIGIQFTFHWLGAALASAIVSFPLVIRAVRVAVEAIDPRLEEAAASMGAGPSRTFFTVTLPLALPGIVAGAILAFARSLGEFGATMTFAGNVMGQTQTLPLATYQFLQTPGKESSAALLVGISIALAVVSTVAAEWLVTRSMALAQLPAKLCGMRTRRTSNRSQGATMGEPALDREA